MGTSKSIKHNVLYILIFTDDPVIITDQEGVEYMLRKLIRQYMEWGWRLILIRRNIQ